MTQPPPDKPPPQKPSTPVIDYNSPTRAAAGAGCFIFALCALILASLYAALAILFFSGNQPALPLLLLIGGLILITAAAILAKKFGLSAALAILLAAICIVLLTFTLCSNYSIL